MSSEGREILPLHPHQNRGVSKWFIRPSFRKKLVRCAKWEAMENNIPTDVINTHTLSGGATALFISGIDWVTIKRWGRWEICISHEYIWHGSSGFMLLGGKISSTTGLTKYLVDVPRCAEKYRMPARRYSIRVLMALNAMSIGG